MKQQALQQLNSFLMRGVVNDDHARELLALFRTTFGACGSLLLASPGKQRWNLIDNVPPQWERDHMRLHHQDMSLALMAKLPPGSWWSAQHNVSAKERELELWDCFRRAGLREVVIANLYNPFRDDLHLALYRDDRAFTREELGALDLLYPQLAGALSTRRAVLAIDGESAPPAPAVYVSFPSGAVELPAAARQVIAQHVGTVSGAGWVRIEQALRTAARRFNQPFGGGRSQRLWPGLRIEFATAPPRRGERLRMLGLLLEEETATARQLPAAVDALLSSRQRAVACAFAAGVSLPIIAEQQRIGVETARTHLRLAYAKLGVRTRADLAMAMAEHG